MHPMGPITAFPWNRRAASAYWAVPLAKSDKFLPIASSLGKHGSPQCFRAGDE